MEFIKVEPNTDGEIQPTFFLSDVKEEQDCLALMSTEGVVSCIPALFSVPCMYQSDIFIVMMAVLRNY